VNIILLYFGVFLAILSVAVAFKLIKNIIKLGFFLSFILFLFLFVTGFFVISDAKEFKNEFPVSNNSFVLVDEGFVIAGFQMLNGSEEPLLFSKKKLDNLTLGYNEDDLFLDNNYKIFFVNSSVFDDAEGLVFIDYYLTYEDLINVFASDDPLSDLSKIIAGDNWLEYRTLLINISGPDHEIKGLLFASLVSEKLSNPSFLLSGIKSGELSVYPETALFTAVRYIPEIIYNKILRGESNGTEILEEG